MIAAALVSVAVVPAPAAAQTAPEVPARALSRKVSPSWGNIRSFLGDVNPYWGNIRSFWGESSPYEGDVTAFWGNIRSFSNGTTIDPIAPSWGNIRSFWGDVGASWGNIRSFWGNIRSFEEAPGDYADLAGQLGGLVTQTETFWGAAVTAKTGLSFRQGFADPLLARYGIDLADPRSLERLDSATREQFFLDWHDQVMQFSGADQVDHWMKTAHWTPHLTQVQGSGVDTVIGLVDFFVAGDTDIQSKVKYVGGVSTFSNGHGAAVGSLILSSHDGKGVMGIAPSAKLAAFNPFDATGTASWADVRKGIVEVTKNGASVVNLSLGVPGWTFHSDWRGVFRDGEVMKAKDKAIYVIAAGNDGITQTQNVNMKDTFDNTFLVVGSIDPLGNISSFSNRPGEVCLTEDTKCEDTGDLKKSGKLKNRFIVAPGELILVSDDKSGVMRASGTSFAAPLVSGAIALIHDRWPWLKSKPRDVAAMILGSARDLGAPGVDGVYGVGMLDVEASQSPLAFNYLKIYQVEGAKTTEIKLDVLQNNGVQSSWETRGIYFSAFEKFPDQEGNSRDFLIPLASRLVGTTKNGNYFQDYLYARLVQWMGGSAYTADGVRMGFSDAGQSAAVTNPYGLKLSMSARQRRVALRGGGARLRMETTMRLSAPSDAYGLSFGEGDGAPLVFGAAGFGLRSDYDPQTGGVNPLLGFASGGAHAALWTSLAPGLRMSVGTTESRPAGREERRGALRLGDASALSRLQDYRAGAMNLRFDYRPGAGVTLAGGYTRLDEANSLLGVRSIQPSDIAGGSQTDAITLSADVALKGGFSLSASATGARTLSGSKGAALRIGSGGLVGSAYQLALAKEGLFGRADRLRVSIAQPLHTERGSVDFTSLAVIDRQTGETGLVTQKIGVGGAKRQFVAEMIYGRSVLNGSGEVSLFGRAHLRPSAIVDDVAAEDRTAALVAGGSINLAF